VELHQLIYFKAIVENGNFTKAAKQLHVSQPALSKQIKLLEEELRVQLFERSSRGVHLTIAGQIFLEHVKKIMQQITLAKLSIEKKANSK
jgi:DNA-binding transcriptional LysR family regulator